jgi:capsule polysaccharide export protein KpsE/RkpR
MKSNNNIMTPPIKENATIQMQIGQLTAGLENINTTLGKLVGDVQECLGDVSALKQDSENINLNLNKLLKSVYEGNGSSLSAKVAVLESKMTLIDSPESRKPSGKFILYAALITGSLGFVGTLLQIIFKVV